MPHLSFTLSSGEQLLFDLDVDHATIGRTPDNDLVLPDPTVSSRHGKFVRHGESYVYQDNISTNGSTVNGEEAGSAVLKPGDQLVLGTCAGVYARGSVRELETGKPQAAGLPTFTDPAVAPGGLVPLVERIDHREEERFVAPDPLDFAVIPAGDFIMGDTLDGDATHPPHEVNVSAFAMQTKAVSRAQWDEVRAWGLKHGYPDLALGEGKAADHPIQMVSWHDVVKWCNAMCEKTGLTPCYYTDEALTTVYRAGITDLDNTMVNWNANGYRLPTEAEWEKSARGGLAGKRFPDGDRISHSLANFNNTRNESYQTGTLGHHPTYGTGSKPYTSPVGSFAANGYGLYDMAGNVSEWCWDRWCGRSYYAASPDSNPQGPVRGPCRVVRGGSWLYEALFTCCACGDVEWPVSARNFIGLRLARGQAQA
jgi:formylglycine-generating enzyme required for sulfatase activity